MSIKPLDDRIFIRTKESAKETKGGVLLPETLKQEPMEGVIMAVGPGKMNKKNKRIPPVLKKGDKVLFGKWSIKEVVIDNETLSVMREDDIIGILTEV